MTRVVASIGVKCLIKILRILNFDREIIIIINFIKMAI